MSLSLEEKRAYVTNILQTSREALMMTDEWVNFMVERCKHLNVEERHRLYANIVLANTMDASVIHNCKLLLRARACLGITSGTIEKNINHAYDLLQPPHDTLL